MSTTTLKPCLVIATGISCTGKSTVLSEFARIVQNSFIIEKDLVNQGILHVHKSDDTRLLAFKDYVNGDNVFPDNARTVKTPFGEMTQVDPKNGFYGRHARDQGYIVAADLARLNMDLGKVPIIDCLVTRQIQDGTLRRFIGQPLLSGYPKYLVHFIADEEECYQRHIERAQRDASAQIRDKEKITSREAFHKFVTEQQPMLPRELQHYNHLLINTSKGNPRECANTLMGYVTK